MFRLSPPPHSARRCGGRILASLLIALALAVAGWFGWRALGPPPPAKKAAGAVPVVSAQVIAGDVPVRLATTGTVSPLQSVEVRAQLSATIRAVHVREGQTVRAGERLFTLDTRNEEANLHKAEAQLAKSRADLANAERTLQRQRELFARKFISQAALDAAQNQADSLRAQVAADQASVAASRVARAYGEIVAPIGGRIGAIPVYPGSLVQPNGAALVTVTQIDPINVGFSLPERELPELRRALDAGGVEVTAQLDGGGTRVGQLVFLDNAVDGASGTIRLKARFDNADGRLWPGMFVAVSLAPRTLRDALSVPAQAVQTGPERKFLYVIGADDKVSIAPVKVLLIQDGRAVIEGVAAGTRVVVEGAQNLRPGSAVVEARSERQKSS